MTGRNVIIMRAGLVAAAPGAGVSAPVGFVPDGTVMILR